MPRFQHHLPTYMWLKITYLCLLSLLISIPSLFAKGLNQDFDLPIWSDNSLWDDQAWSVASRLQLRSTASRQQGNETYRGEYAGKTKVLGAPLYALDLIPQDKQVQRIILGFINEADLHAAGKYDPQQFPRQSQQAFNQIRIKLTQRLGRPAGEKKSLSWKWLNHAIKLEQTDKAVLVHITPVNGGSSTATGSSSRVQTPLTQYVKRFSNGDTLITDIPKISQGNRGYCVPATWEKVLRHYGLDYNVYDLSSEGATTVSGSTFTRFTSRMKGMLQPHSYQVKYLRFYPEDLDSLRQHIDRGTPLIWHMDAQNLEQWVLRNQHRRTRLPQSDQPLKMNNQPAPHALLIIGYNRRESEIALSDSTQLGSRSDAIWIHVEEAETAHYRRHELLAVIPPRRTSGRDFIKKAIY